MGEEMEPWGVGRARSQAVVILSFCWLRQTGLAFLCLYSPRCLVRVDRVSPSSWVVMAMRVAPVIPNKQKPLDL